MRRGVFVTGTDTGVGKTVVAAAIFHRYRRQVPLRYWKPIQTGIEMDDDTAEVTRLAGCTDAEIRREGVRLPRPVSPHLAARWAGVAIDVDALALIPKVEPGTERWIVEGAGGVLVPVTEVRLMVDLMVNLGLPIVVAARSTLGTINHTLLTLEALRARHIAVAGVVMIGEPNADNRAAIETYGRVRVLADMPRFDPLTPDALAAWAATEFDPARMLSEHLT